MRQPQPGLVNSTGAFLFSRDAAEKEGGQEGHFAGTWVCCYCPGLGGNPQHDPDGINSIPYSLS